jgi:hypothetical protein
MIRPRIFFTSAALFATAGLVGFLPVTPSAAAATSGSGVTTHPASGCGDATKVVTPTAGQPLTAQALHLSGKSSILDYAAERHVRWLSTLTCKPGPQRSPDRPATGVVPNAQNSTIWSGYALNDAAATEVEGFWNLPPVTGNGREDTAAVWVGLGGWGGSGDLVQDGTNSFAHANGTTEYYFWIEDFPAPLEQVTNLIPAPGDAVAAGTAWDQSTFSTYYILCDWPQNTCVDALLPTNPPGISVEWIVERLTVSGHATPLANYGQVDFTNCYYFEPGNQQGIPLANGHPTDIYMFGDTGHELSAVGPLDSPTSFLTEWINFA